MNQDIYAEGLVARKRAPWVIPAIIGMGILFVVALIVSVMYSPWGMLALCAWILVFFIGKRYLNCEFEYIFVTSEMTVTKIYSQDFRKKQVVFDMHEVETVEPLNQGYLDNQKNNRNAVFYDFTSHLQDAGDVYMVAFSQNGKNCFMTFEPDEKMLKAMWRCSPSKVKIEK